MKEKNQSQLKKFPWTHQTFFNRPHWTRRHFFEMLGAGVTGAFLPQRYARAAEVGSTAPRVTTKNTAQECHLHPAGRRAQPHRHVRPQDGRRRHARRPSTPRPSTAFSFPRA